MSKSALDKLGWRPGMAARVIARPDGLDAIRDARSDAGRGVMPGVER